MEECERIERADSLLICPEDCYLLQVSLSGVFFHHLEFFICQNLASLLFYLFFYELLLLLDFVKISFFGILGKLVHLLWIEKLLV